MSRGRLTKKEVEWKIYQLKHKLDNENCTDETKRIANLYFNYLLEYMDEFHT